MFKPLSTYLAFRGGAKIPHRRGANRPLDFAIFSKNLHEIEKILGHRERPQLDPPVSFLQRIEQNKPL